MNFDIQGHRGCRGLMPENSIAGFIKALEIGITTLEMDVVISKDKKVLLSHEPFLSHEICFGSKSEKITTDNEWSFNLYEMTYDEIKQCDCGSKPHPRFPEQQKIKAYKPLLSEVIDSVESHMENLGLPAVYYNIETKTTPAGDNIFHPEPEEFVGLLLEIIRKKGIEKRTIIQSFDPRTLKVARKKYPEIKLALLIENKEHSKKNLKRLGFIPEIYSPDYALVDSTLIEFCQQNNMLLVPWTVNEKKEMKRLIDMGVDGIITDYPDRLNELVLQL